MMAVLGVLCLVISNILQSNTIFLYLFSTLFTYIATEECGLKFGFLTFAVISLAACIVVVNKIGMISYIIIVGYYPVIKHIVEHLNINRAFKNVLKIIFALVTATVAFFVLTLFMNFNLPDLMNMPLMFITIYSVGIVIFIVYDILLTMGIKFYALRLRNRLR